ncbi:MAG: lytic transglycosylase domain-containing protein [Treponema sp.]|jgi:soluble lytic murein transglycosylase-like protein|nr:lytic transglycosylase domain-containing protein [Treponema sp.]
MNSAIASLILAIAANVGVPPYFVLSVALTENPALDPLAVHVNRNGTEDRGVMQLNSQYLDWFVTEFWDGKDFDWRDPGMNITVGVRYLKRLIDMPKFNEWQAVLCYNAGPERVKRGDVPDQAIEYANRVFEKWNRYRGYKF